MPTQAQQGENTATPLAYPPEDPQLTGWGIVNWGMVPLLTGPPDSNPLRDAAHRTFASPTSAAVLAVLPWDEDIWGFGMVFFNKSANRPATAVGWEAAVPRLGLPAADACFAEMTANAGLPDHRTFRICPPDVNNLHPRLVRHWKHNEHDAVLATTTPRPTPAITAQFRERMLAEAERSARKRIAYSEPPGMEASYNAVAFAWWVANKSFTGSAFSWDTSRSLWL